MNGIIYFEDGTVFTGKGFGKKGTSVGEIVFNTSMTGYSEILTDPSYAGQIINMTYPLIGNYGVSKDDFESNNIYAKGFIVKSVSMEPSNYTSEENLDDMLKRMNVVGVSDVDTREITKKIRNLGSMKCVITNEDLTIRELERYLKETNLDNNLVDMVSVKEKYNIKGKGKRVVLLDFGVKENIIENLKLRECDITVVPHNTTSCEIMKMNPDGIVLSNGPGNPEDLPSIVKMVKEIINYKPIFGICLGHQILSLSLDAKTYKMKFGHRGGNHGVYDIERDRAFITSQNHGYAVNKNSIDKNNIVITHINLNDNTVEGIKHKTLPVFSVQFHPEGSPGPIDTAYLFDRFIEYMK